MQLPHKSPINLTPKLFHFERCFENRYRYGHENGLYSIQKITWSYPFVVFLLSRKRASTTQEMKFSVKDFFSKCDQICRKLRIWSHLRKKCLMENFIFCTVKVSLNVKWIYRKVKWLFENSSAGSLQTLRYLEKSGNNLTFLTFDLYMLRTRIITKIP